MFGKKKKTIEDANRAFWEKRIIALREDVETLRSENAEKDAIIRELEGRMVALEKSYGPLFDYFLSDKGEITPDKAEYFQPQHVIHPDGDYEEKRK